jgi:hypothetical protein
VEFFSLHGAVGLFKGVCDFLLFFAPDLTQLTHFFDVCMYIVGFVSDDAVFFLLFPLRAGMEGFPHIKDGWRMGSAVIVEF